MGPPPLGGLGGPPPLSGLGGPPPLSGLGGLPSLSGLGGPPTLSGLGGPPKLSGLGGPPSLSGLGGPPPLSGLGGPPPMSGLGGPPPLSGLGGPPRLNMGPPPIGGLGGPPPLSGLGGPPPLSGLGGPPPMSGLGGPPPLSGLGGPPRLNMGPPPIGGLGGPPPLSGLGGPPPLSGLGGPPRLNMGPPPIGGLGGPPPLSGLGGPPSLGGLGGPPPIGGLGGPPRLNIGPPPIGGGGPPPLGPSFPINQLNTNKGLPTLNLAGNNQAPMLNISQVQLKQKQKCQPQVPLRNIMWTILPPNQILNTIWSEIDDSNWKLDTKLLETEFAKIVSKESKPLTQSVIMEKKHLLDQERNKVLEIILGRLKTNNKIMSNSLLIFDQNFLTLTNLESLDIIAPTPEEAALLQNEKQIQEYGPAEQFMYEMIKVKGYHARIKSYKFMKKHKEMFDDLEPKIQILNKAFQFLLTSKKIKDIFEVSLAIGNYLNGTSARGGAYAFNLSSLEKLNDMKMSDNKRTLLMYIIDLIEEKHGQFIEKEELEYIIALSTLPVSQLNIDLGAINKEYRFVPLAMKSQTDQKENNIDNIQQNLEQFEKTVKIRLDEDKEQIQKVLDGYEMCTKYFLENSKDSSEKFGEKFYKFFQSAEKAKQIKLKMEEDFKKLEEKKNKEEQKVNASLKQSVRQQKQETEEKPRERARDHDNFLSAFIMNQLPTQIEVNEGQKLNSVFNKNKETLLSHLKEKQAQKKNKGKNSMLFGLATKK